MSLSKEEKSISRLDLVLSAKNNHGISLLSAGLEATCVHILCHELSIPVENINLAEIRQFIKNARTYYRDQSSYLSSF